jgi:hypothetical protein
MVTTSRSLHWNWYLSRHVRVLALHRQQDDAYDIPCHSYKNDFHSERFFPRIVAMQGDGKTSYDLPNDGASNMIGECTVRADVYEMLLRF